GFRDYAGRLSAKRVEIDPRARREAVIRISKVILEGLEVRLVPDDWLLDWIVNSCEWPRPLAGNFDSRFLGLPREILVTVMRCHQQYFAVDDAQGSIPAHFISCVNLDGNHTGVI